MANKELNESKYTVERFHKCWKDPVVTGSDGLYLAIFEPLDIHGRITVSVANNRMMVSFGQYAYVFGRFITDVVKFFSVSKINPYYWSEKLEAMPERGIWDRIDTSAVWDEIVEHVANYNGIDYEEAEDLCSKYHDEYDIDENETRCFDSIYEIMKDTETYIEIEDVCGIIESCRDYDPLYINACNAAMLAADAISRYTEKEDT